MNGNRKDVVYLNPGESMEAVKYRARIATGLHCPKCETSVLLRVADEERTTLACNRCLSVYAMPTIEIQEVQSPAKQKAF